MLDKRLTNPNAGLAQQLGYIANGRSFIRRVMNEIVRKEPNRTQIIVFDYRLAVFTKV